MSKSLTGMSSREKWQNRNWTVYTTLLRNFAVKGVRELD